MFPVSCDRAGSAEVRFSAVSRPLTIPCMSHGIHTLHTTPPFCPPTVLTGSRHCSHLLSTHFGTLGSPPVAEISPLIKSEGESCKIAGIYSRNVVAGVGVVLFYPTTMLRRLKFSRLNPGTKCVQHSRFWAVHDHCVSLQVYHVSIPYVVP